MMFGWIAFVKDSFHPAMELRCQPLIDTRHVGQYRRGLVVVHPVTLLTGPVADKAVLSPIDLANSAGVQSPLWCYSNSK